MTEHLTPIIVALKTLTLVLGGSITFFAYRAYRRTNSTPLGVLTIGFGLVTIGSLLAGLIDQLTSLAAGYALMTESALTAIGFAVVLYSLYTR